MTDPSGPGVCVEPGTPSSADHSPSAPAALVRSGVRFWRSPPDQPRWARPALLAIAALAMWAYAWGIGSVNLEPFYGAARSMSESRRNDHATIHLLPFRRPEAGAPPVRPLKTAPD